MKQTNTSIKQIAHKLTDRFNPSNDRVIMDKGEAYDAFSKLSKEYRLDIAKVESKVYHGSDIWTDTVKYRLVGPHQDKRDKARAGVLPVVDLTAFCIK